MNSSAIHYVSMESVSISETVSASIIRDWCEV